MDILTSADRIPQQIYGYHFNEFPLQDSGTDSSSSWPELLRKRAEVVSEANWEIAHELKRKYGEDSDEAVSAEIFARLTPSVTKIALDQYKKIDAPQSRSWEDESPEGAETMTAEIDEILRDPDYRKFLQKNSSFQIGLKLLCDLSGISDKDRLMELSLGYEEICKKAINSGEPLLFIPYFAEGYYKNGNSNEIIVDLIFPPSNDLITLSQNYNDIAIKNMQTLSGQTNHKPETQNIFGLTIGSAGFTLLSQTAGMSLDSGGILLSYNSYKEKYKSAWKKSLREVGEAQDTDYTPYLIALYFHHEHAHNFFPGSNSMSELLADIPSTVSLLSLFPDIDKTKALCFMLGEFAPEVTSSKTGNDVIDGYTYSAVYNINKLIECGIIIVSPDSSFRFDFNDQKIEAFSEVVMATHQKLLMDDDETKRQILDMTPSENTLKLAEILA